MITELDREGIQGILPHRYPFPLIDRVRIDGMRAIGVCDDPSKRLLTVYLPDGRVAPNPLIIEALAEVGAVALLSLPEYVGKLAILTGSRKWKFRPVERGYPMVLNAELTRLRSDFGRGSCVAISNGLLVAKGEISFGIMDRS